MNIFEKIILFTSYDEHSGKIITIDTQGESVDLDKHGLISLGAVLLRETGVTLKGVHSKQCDVCGKEFISKRSDARFCRDQCRNTASKRRVRAERRKNKNE